jgi:hypothetical protein
LLGDRLIIQEYHRLGSNRVPVMKGSPLSTNFKDAKMLLGGLFGNKHNCYFIAVIEDDSTDCIRELSMDLQSTHFDDTIVKQIRNNLEFISRVGLLAKHPFTAAKKGKSANKCL